MAGNHDRAFVEIDHPAWRRPAPRARSATMALFAWQDPGLVFLLGVLAAAPFALAAFFSPALLSLAPTVDLIAPIADARAVASGAAKISAEASPFHLALLLIGDLFFDAPGRIHLAAKAVAALIVAFPFAYFAAARFPAAQAVLMTAALAAFVAAPFSGAVEISLALFMVAAIALVTAPADESRRRALVEGVVAGAILFTLWLSSPLFALLGFLALSACPFLTGKAGLPRYAAALGLALVLIGVSEAMSPGLTLARALAASSTVGAADLFKTSFGAFGLAGVAASTAIVILATAVFGGRDHARGWVAAVVLLALSFATARIAGAQTQPLFMLAAAIAAFSVASPFYDGVFRAHDRASIAVAASVASLTIFWTLAVVVQASGQFALQYRTAASAAANIRAEFGLVQPGGPTIVRWVEEGRFSTPQARELFSTAPVDQSAMLLEAAERARALSREGVEVAILTGADTACVLAGRRNCSADGRAAAERAKVVFVPRLDLDAATAAVKGRSEAFLYTEFKMVERTPRWDIWVRRGVETPAGVTPTL